MLKSPVLPRRIKGLLFTNKLPSWMSKLANECFHCQEPLFHPCLLCFSSKTHTGTKRQLEAIKVCKDVKLEVTVNSSSDVEPKRAKISAQGSPTKPPGKADGRTSGWFGWG